MKVWVVIENNGHEGCEHPKAIFSNQEAAEKYVEQLGGYISYDLQEYEILDHCPPPRIAQTYEDQNFGLFTPKEKINIGPMSLYPKFYMMDLMEAMIKKSVNTYSWNITDRKKTKWERFKQAIGL